MGLNKQPLPINFTKGIDTKTDPFQIAPGNFIALQNTVFTKAGQLTKRNGYGALTALPANSNASYITTFNGNLTAIGTSLSAFSNGSSSWVNKGVLNPLSVATLPLIRNTLNQSYADTAIALNRIACTVFSETNGITTSYKYVVSDTVTGQNIIAPTAIPVTTGIVRFNPRVFLLSNYFVIMFDNQISSVDYLSYIAISTSNPSAPTTVTAVSSTYAPSSHGSFDGVVANNTLYFAWPSNAAGGQIKVSGLNYALSQTNTFSSVNGYTATNVSVTADNSGATPTIYISTFDSVTNVAKTFALGYALNGTPVVAPTTIPLGAGILTNITSTANNGICTVIAEIVAAYSYDSSIKTNFIEKNTITMLGVVGTPAVVARSVGLASKAFVYNSDIYFLSVYGGPQGQVSYQPSYFLLNLSGDIVSRIAYQNAGAYYVTGLSSPTIINNVVKIPYLYKDLIQAVNKNTNIPVGSQTAGIYSQTGINLATFSFGTLGLGDAEIGNNLLLAGGYLSSYDGYSITEQNFFVYPENVEAAASITGGTMTAQTYFYQVTYEWTDNQGNAHRSAPSIPVSVITTGNTSSVVVSVPTLRLTYKVSTPVKIVIYRWSTAQQEYYQVTSITSPLLNDKTVDSLSFTDTLADNAILGNNLIYTTGGVVEDIGPPPTNQVTLYQSRLFLVDAEDPNLLWYSKQVIESTPVEMSDLFTIYVAPTTGSQGSTGPITALSVLDDKLIIFKENAIYYINGVGPDNTGANNQFSEPTFITATVGCSNPNSIVFMPNGLMFQSDKGIWLLGRDLSTKYIGAPVEKYNQDVVVSAINIPGTNQVRFTLNSNITLMYDYYFNQWGSFVNIPAVSSTLYESLHTFIDSFGRVFQETVGQYLDNSSPTLISFTTGWMNLAGLQGYERAYFFYLLATYYSPHTLKISIAYDYEQSPSQTTLIKPDNFSQNYGLASVYGDTPTYGGQSSLEQWRVFFNQQKCQSFQITIEEIYDGTYAVPPGAGLTISGVNMIVGMKRGYTTIKAARSVG
jgi:hypothetical protein